MNRRVPRPPFDFALQPRAIAEGLVKTAEARLGVALPRAEVPTSVIGLRVPEAWLEEPIGESGWLVAYRIAVQGGRPVIAELRIFPAEPREGRLLGEWSGALCGIAAPVPKEFSPRRFKDVHTDTVLARLPERVAEWRRWFMVEGLTAIAEAASGPQADALGELLANLETFVLRPLTQAPRKRRPPGRHPIDKAFLARVGALHEEAWHADPRRTIQGTTTLLKQREGLHKSQQTVRGYIVRARRAHILTPTREGRGGGWLTEYGRQLLREQGLSIEPAAVEVPIGHESEARSRRRGSRKATSRR